jgi:hypothetical protein
MSYFDGEAPSRATIDALLAFKKRFASKARRLLLLTQTIESYVEKKEIEVYPLRG